jgi:ferredoxin
VTYVIAESCTDVKDQACVEECPVDYGACEPVCPVEVILYEDDVPGEWAQFTPPSRPPQRTTRPWPLDPPANPVAGSGDDLDPSELAHH